MYLAVQPRLLRPQGETNLSTSKAALSHPEEVLASETFQNHSATCCLKPAFLGKLTGDQTPSQK